MAKKRVRLDILLVEKGLAETRSEARAAIMAGLVTVNGMPSDKPGRQLDIDTKVALKAPARRFVSRGGEKIAGAHKVFQFSISGKTALDGGASTGGFTHFLLENGARKVFAVDVGYGQLAWSLRQDERVVVMERTNLRHLTSKELNHEKPTLAVLDLAFISLSKIWSAVENCCAEESEVVALVKPQFEAGPNRIGKGGIIRDHKLHREILKEVVDEVKKTTLAPIGLTYSPIKGPKGNIEFFLYLRKGTEATVTSEDVDAVVTAAHKELAGGKE